MLGGWGLGVVADGVVGWGGVLTDEGLGFVKPLWPKVVASSGSKSSKNEGLGFVKLPWPAVVASGGSKFSKNEGRVFLSL